MKRIGLWRLRRAYRRATSIETKLGMCAEAVDLRVEFAKRTLSLSDRVLKGRGVGRQQRRDVKRAFVRAR